MKNTKLFILAICTILVLVLLSFILYIFILTPKADKIKSNDLPNSYFISQFTYIDYQEHNDCSAYATAYVLRYLGENIKGTELYSQMKRNFSIMTAHSIVKAVKNRGYSAKAYHGSIDSLKQRLTQGTPIICFIRNQNDTHYVVVVGYDNDYIYMVDSIKNNANVEVTNLFNRKESIADFEMLWNTNLYFVNNIFIIINNC